MPTQISVQSVTKAYGDRLLLDGVTFAVTPNRRTGIIGENGSGKSTLLRLLAGREEPDDGQVIVTADGGVGYLAQDMYLPGQLTVQQAIDAALADLRAMEARLRELEPRLAGGNQNDLTEYGNLATTFELRGGYEADARVEQARVHLASVLAANSEVLLLDEPTNHLDDTALSWLEGYLGSRRGTTVVVSHDRVFLEQVATGLIEVDADRRTLVRYGTGYAGYLVERAAARQRWQQAYEQWQAESDRLREVAATTARQVAPGRAMKDRNKIAYDRNAGRVQQSVASRVRNAELRLRRLQADPVPPPPGPLRFEPPRHPAAAAGVLLAAREVTFAGRLKPTTLTVATGQRLLIRGPNGAGKSTLLRILAGDLAPDGGQVTRSGRIGYLPQEVSTAEPERTLLAAFAHGRPGPAEEYISSLLSLGLFTPESLTVPIGRLSTGQRQRLAVARLFSEPVDLLLLDEPTNHLSLGLVEELEAALAEYQGAVVVVSHDRRLCRRWSGEAREVA